MPRVHWNLTTKRLAGPGPPRGWRGPGAKYFRGPYLKCFSRKQPPPPPVDNFLGKKIFRTSMLQLLSRDFISIFHAKFRYLAQKTRYLVLCAEIFNTQKRLGPNKKFSGTPSTSGPGAICHPAPLSAALGRTGRDGKQARASLHYNGHDIASNWLGMTEEIYMRMFCREDNILAV